MARGHLLGPLDVTLAFSQSLDRFTWSGHSPVTGIQAPTEIWTTSGFR